MHALACDLDPLFILATLFAFPDLRAVVIAGPRRDRRDHGVRADCLPADFHHSHGSAANLRERSVENQATALQQAESVNEEADAGAEAEHAPEQKCARVLRAAGKYQ